MPHTVLAETAADPERPGASAIASFVQQYARVHADRHDAIYTRLISGLDEGESQAIGLAHALQCSVLMDERRGRAAARAPNFNVTTGATYPVPCLTAG